MFLFDFFFHYLYAVFNSYSSRKNNNKIVPSQHWCKEGENGLVYADDRNIEASLTYDTSEKRY